MARSADVKGKCASPWCQSTNQSVGAWCSAACKQAHSRVRKGEKPMPPFPEGLTPVTVIVSAEYCTATFKDDTGETVQIRELAEGEALKLIEKLKPVFRSNADGDWFRYTMESVPDIGNGEEVEGDWG